MPMPPPVAAAELDSAPRAFPKLWNNSMQLVKSAYAPICAAILNAIGSDIAFFSHRVNK